MSVDLSSLNASQRTAAEWQDGPVLVLAGPGSGKTRVLTFRVARLIEESPNERFKVLAVTFTNKAATEMRHRVDALLSHGRERAHLTTFHALAVDILRQHGVHVGLRPEFGILGEQSDREAVLGEAVRAVADENDGFTPRAAQLLPTIDRMLNECIPVGETCDWLQKQPNADQIGRVYGEYRRRLIESNQLDFGSLLALAVGLLEEKPAIARQIRRVYRYVSVDECQDTNSSQFRLLLQLVPDENPNLFVVADDDQVIYQWNGASADRIYELRRRFTMDLIQLPENYRCPPDVIELANSLIQFNSDRPAEKQPLTANKRPDGKDTVFHVFCPTAESERRWLAETVAAMSDDERTKSVILARRKKLLDEVLETFQELDVPAYIALRRNEFQSAPYRWLHAMLRLANAPQDREQLQRVTRAFFQLEGITIPREDVEARASLTQAGYLGAWLDLAQARREVSAETVEILNTARKELLERLNYWVFVGKAEVWFAAIERKPDIVDEPFFNDFQDEREIWGALKAEIAKHFNLNEMSLYGYLQELDLRAKEKPAPKGAIRCMTVASSKGMEFQHVFLIGMVEDELPSYYARKAGDESEEMKEERRNCFVAITRAEETLTLTYAAKYGGWNKEPSRFLYEMGLLGGPAPNPSR